jgi:hypothetical protein
VLTTDAIAMLRQKERLVFRFNMLYFSTTATIGHEYERLLVTTPPTLQ